MRVGILTSHRAPCGVSEYSNRLADAFAALPDVEPVILAARADERRSIPEESPHEVHDVAKIGLWSDDGRYRILLNAFDGLDVVHVQYQSMLLNQEPLAILAREFPGPTAITFHDSCQRPDFPYDAFDLHFSHRWNVGPPNVIAIPFGIEDRAPIIRTFGLGRTRSDVIAPICKRNGWIFEDASSHEPIHGGGQSWRSHADLIEWLRGADAIVLWYDPQPMAGSSQAARTAMASRRLVVTNDTEWFSDLPPRAKGFLKVTELWEMEDALRQQFQRAYVEENSWDQVARLLLEHYARVRVPS
jgi:hypothetical protein